MMNDAESRDTNHNKIENRSSDIETPAPPRPDEEKTETDTNEPENSASVITVTEPDTADKDLIAADLAQSDYNTTDDSIPQTTKPADGNPKEPFTKKIGRFFQIFDKDSRKKLLFTLKRFPFALSYLVILNIFLISGMNDAIKGISEQVAFILLWGCSIGCILSITLRLWYESYRIQTKTKNILFGAAQIVHLVMTFYLSTLVTAPSAEHYSLLLGMSAFVLMLIVSVFTLPFFKQKTDLPHWGFIFVLIRAFFVSFLTVGILTAGLSLLYVSLSKLFDLEISENILITIVILFFALLAPIKCLSYIPAGEFKKNSEDTASSLVNPDFTYSVSKEITKFVNYLIIPLIVLYLIILYAYEVKILIEWELPRGWCSILVTICMIGVILIEFLLYPKVHEKNNQKNMIVLRGLPIAMLPLLILMTIGIIRRFSDYGITIQRLYLLLFNLWCYGVCIGLIITKSRRIFWISISFAALFALSSCLPFINVSNITRMYLYNEIKTDILNSHYSLPLSRDDYTNWLSNNPEQENLHSKLLYLERFYEGSLNGLIQESAQIYSYVPQNTGSTKQTVEENYQFDLPSSFNYEFNPDTKYRKIKFNISALSTLSPYDKDHIRINVNGYNDKEDVEFILPLSLIPKDAPKEGDEQSNDKPIVLETPKATLIITHLYWNRATSTLADGKTITSYGYNNIQGVILYKE